MPTNAKKIRIGGVSHDIEDTAARTSIGTLSSLKTTAKTNLVSAVNEVFDSVDGLEETYAKQDGYYQDMAVGAADQVISTKMTEDSAPYKFRTSGGSADIGNRAYMDKIVGGTVAWNQLWNASSRTATATAGNVSQLLSVYQKTFVSGHKYLALCKQNGAVGSITRNTIVYNDGSTTYYKTSSQNHHLAAGMHYWIFSAVSSTTSGSIWMCCHTPDVDVTYSDPQLFDLTQMFGQTVADYIYSLEQSTAGAGVAFFRSLFPNSYYEYNAGELISVEGLQSHDTVGFNAWDEEWESGSISASTGNPSPSTNDIRSKNFIPVLPNTQYYIKIPGTVIVDIYDKDKNFLTYVRYGTGNAVFNTTKKGMDGYYIKFGTYNSSYGTTYNNDICINLSHSGARNGEYEPYKKHSYPLDSSLTLRGIPRLDSSNQLYWDGDEYAPDGTVTRRYGIVDLGAISWLKHNDGYFFSNAIFDTGAANSRSINSIGLADRDIHPKDCLYVGWHATIYCFYADASTTAELTEAFRGKYLVYQLATPTTETADAYQQIQNVDDYGTEEFVSTSIVPVGHVTRYPANLRDKLQHLPDLAASNGTYVILQSGSQMTLAPLTTPTELPAAPSTDGTYTLKATVSNGAVTYSWGA